MKKKRVIKETGEWDDNDEEMKAWKQDINDRAIELASLVKGEASPAEGFDKYQGPYAHISDTPKGTVTLWPSEYEGIYRLETRDDWLEGDIETLAKKLTEAVENRKFLINKTPYGFTEVTYKGYNMVFIFFCMTYFTQCNNF